MNKVSRRIFTVLMMVEFLLYYVSEACPSLCVCKWRNGKQTVECNERNLVAIPDGMDAGTQVLEFSGNLLGALHTEKFLHMELINLQRIYLARCTISTIDDRTFSGLTNLVELDLSGNLLESIPSATFVDCPSLMRLTLNTNPIRTIRSAAFSHLSYLNTLELSNCEISTIEEEAFLGLNSLEWLRLDGNKMSLFGSRRILPGYLRGVELQGNPWKCDCHLRELHSWLESFSIPQSAEPTCTGPAKFARRPIKSIPSEELACLPDVSPATTFFLEIGEGKNISLSCQITAIPEAGVTWWFQGQQLQNDTLISPGARLLYYIEDGTETKYSELFIYNTKVEDNGTFVCSAENAAGIVQSNYTIRIIVQKEPLIVIVAALRFDYLLGVGLAVVLLVVILACCVIVSLLRCLRRRSREEKRHKTKEVALTSGSGGGGGNSHSSVDGERKCAVIHESVKQASAHHDISCANMDPQRIFYGGGGGGGGGGIAHQDFLEVAKSNVVISGMPMMTTTETTSTNQVRSPATLRRLVTAEQQQQLEQNPDLINDTESIGRRRAADGAGGGDEDELIQQNMSSAVAGSLPYQITYSNHHQSAGISERKLFPLQQQSWVDVEGYPVDYGLPKLIKNSTNRAGAENFYRTLPHKRHQVPPTGTITRRYSRDVEFIPSSSSYDHYCPDVRYTADGYPERPSQEPVSLSILPSPPEAYRTDNNSYPSMPGATWVLPSLPAHLHMFEPSQNMHENSNSHFVSGSCKPKRCVEAQTNSEASSVPRVNSVSVLVGSRDGEVPTESPDEGYEGEPTVVL